MNQSRNRLCVVGKPHERKHEPEDGALKLTTFVPLQFKRRGLKRVVVGPQGSYDLPIDRPPTSVSVAQDIPLLKAIARGVYWQNLLDKGAFSDAAAIAQREGIHKATVNEFVRLALLAPDIVQATLDGKLPRTMSLELLVRMSLPLDWAKQREMIANLG